MTVVVSQNGYTANDRQLVASFTIPGTTRKVTLRKGDTSVILLDFLAWLHQTIEPLDVGEYDDWGYAERTIRGSATTLSNHASGTAVDANAVQHPLGVHGTWSAEEKRLIEARLATYDGCIRWGENYTGRIDAMHFEINRGAADCRRVADRIRGGSAAPADPQEDAMRPDDRAYFDQRFRDLWDRWGVRLANPAEPTGPTRDRLTDLWDRLDHLEQAVVSAPRSGPAALSDADADRVAERVVHLLSLRLTD